MSGGSLDYACWKVENAADQIDAFNPTPLQKAFAVHLRLVAKALKDVEWVLSGDYGQGDDDEAIKAVLGDFWQYKAIEAVREDAEKTIKQLQALLAPR